MMMTITSAAGELLRRSLAVIVVAALTVGVMGSPVRASEHGDSGHGGGHGEAHGATTRPYDPTLPRTFEIGDVYIRNFRPTHNEIANIRFTLHVVFAPGTSDEVMAEMVHWQRRLRDQAITAARSTEPDDLSEPGLERVQRLMLLRIRRLPLPQPVTGVYLTDFAVGSG
jgi:flagellar basal body-associated protein FliL